MIVLADADLPMIDQALSTHFDVVTYTNQDDLRRKIEEADILICRSTMTIDEQLLKGTSIQLVATATSGTNHIDTSFLSQQRIALVTAKGVNASAVTDWNLAVLSHIAPFLTGNRIGIIGMGHVGSLMKQRLSLLGYEVVANDPLLASQPHVNHVPLNRLAQCDAIFVHANLHYDPPYASDNLVNQSFLELLHPTCFLINAARGGIVNEFDVSKTDVIKRYCTDVYVNEPAIDASIVDNALICTPHIAGHTVEAKINAVIKVSEAIHRHFNRPMPAVDYLQNAMVINLSSQSWQQDILTHYDPMQETILLKEARDKSGAFIQLRQSHLRHALKVG